MESPSEIKRGVCVYSSQGRKSKRKRSSNDENLIHVGNVDNQEIELFSISQKTRKVETVPIDRHPFEVKGNISEHNIEIRNPIGSHATPDPNPYYEEIRDESDLENEAIQGSRTPVEKCQNNEGNDDDLELNTRKNVTRIGPHTPTEPYPYDDENKRALSDSKPDNSCKDEDISQINTNYGDANDSDNSEFNHPQQRSIIIGPRTPTEPYDDDRENTNGSQHASDTRENFQNPSPGYSPYYEEIGDTPLEQIRQAINADDYITPKGRKPIASYRLTTDGDTGSSANSSEDEDEEQSPDKPCPPECLKHSNCIYPPALMEMYEACAPLRTDCFLSPSDLQSRWPEGYAMWRIMLKKDNNKIDEHIFDKHPVISHDRRAHTIAWMSKSTEKLGLSREAFHLAVFYLDRFLSVTSSAVSRWDFKCTSVAAVYVAMKMEERLAPEMREFLIIVDNPISLKLLGESRVKLIKALDFDLLPVTIDAWLTFFLRLARMDRESSEPTTTLPDGAFNRYLYHFISRVTDLCLLDPASLKYSYRTMAATSLLVCIKSPTFALSVSGLTWTDIAECYRWMLPFLETLEDNEVCCAGSKHVYPDDSDDFDIHCHFDSWTVYNELHDPLKHQTETQVDPNFATTFSPELACIVTHKSQLGFTSTHANLGPTGSVGSNPTSHGLGDYTIQPSQPVELNKPLGIEMKSPSVIIISDSEDE